MIEIMNDEELSELAEALQDACQGKKVSASGHSADGYYCPLGALFPQLPSKPGLGALRNLLPTNVAWSFIEGFEEAQINDMTFIKAYELGQLFREMYP